MNFLILSVILWLPGTSMSLCDTPPKHASSQDRVRYMVECLLDNSSPETIKQVKLRIKQMKCEQDSKSMNITLNKNREMYVARCMAPLTRTIPKRGQP